MKPATREIEVKSIQESDDNPQQWQEPFTDILDMMVLRLWAIAAR